MNKRMIIGMGMIWISFSLFSCATLEKDECLTADWYQIGYEDGANGYPLSRIGKHRKACARHGVAPDMPTYEDGHDRGLVEFCTPVNGYRAGLNGRAAGNVCAGDLHEPFMTGYNTGRDIYLLKREVRKEERDQEDRRREITRVETELKQKEADMGKACATSSSCRKAMDAIRRLDRQLDDLRQDIRSAEFKIRSRKRTLGDMKANARY